MTLNDKLLEQFKVLSDASRLEIFQMLSKEQLCACHILEAFDITQPTLSYHMKLLVDSGLVMSTKEGNLTRYAINKEASAYLEAFFHSINEKEANKKDTRGCTYAK